MKRLVDSTCVATSAARPATKPSAPDLIKKVYTPHIPPTAKSATVSPNTITRRRCPVRIKYKRDQRYRSAEGGKRLISSFIRLHFVELTQWLWCNEPIPVTPREDSLACEPATHSPTGCPAAHA